MAKKPPPKQVGAEKKLFHVTYSQIGRWVGLAPRSVIQYASQGQFDSSDLESVLCWVNARRQAKGLPMIGEPDSSGPDPEPPESQPETAKFPPSVRPPATYNPLTGEFEQ